MAYVDLVNASRSLRRTLDQAACVKVQIPPIHIQTSGCIPAWKFDLAHICRSSERVKPDIPNLEEDILMRRGAVLKGHYVEFLNR